jgi:hypothetical protein
MVSGAARLGFPPMPLGFRAGDGRAEASQDFTETTGTRGRFPTFASRRAAFSQPDNFEEHHGRSR